MLNAAEEQAIKLRRDGMSIAKIVNATGLPERKVKELIATVSKPAKTKTIVKKIPTPFAKSVDRVFALASRAHGIRDYELRDTLHKEYSSTWNTTTGHYNSNYDDGHIKRVKQKVRERAAQEDCNVIFVMDWADEEMPTASREFLEAAATDLMSRIKSHVDEFMEHHATRWSEDSEDSDLAQRKQRYAAERHLLKLAIKDYGKEPLEVLLERSRILTDALEGTPDVSMLTPASHSLAGAGKVDAETTEYYPEPSRSDPFLDYAESLGWLRK